LGSDPPSRHIKFESILNFRDLGGLRTRDGRTTVQGRLFRSGDLSALSTVDRDKLRREIGITSVIDLRSTSEASQSGIGMPPSEGIRYRNIQFMPDGREDEESERRYRSVSSMGEFYILISGEKLCAEGIIEALEFVAEKEHHPLVFHCYEGKDRTGVLAGIILSLLKVPEADIVADYAFSELSMPAIIERVKKTAPAADEEPELADFFWKAVPESMASFLAHLNREYGSAEGYIEAKGAEKSLVSRLREALLD
jgi:protein-tyrosine phosphatase